MTEQIPQPRTAGDGEETARFLNYRDLLRTMPLGFASLSADGKIEEGNPAAARLLGRSGTDLHGCSLADCLAPGAAAKLRALLDQVFHCGGEARCELEVEAPDGGRTLLQLDAQRHGAGSDARCHAFFSGPLRRPEPDVMLRRLALVARLTTNLVVITDANGIIEWVNEGFTRTTGFTREEAVGRRPGQFLQGPETDAAEVARIRESVRNGRSVLAELLNYKKDGSTYWLRIEIQPIRAESGNIDGFIAVETDVTEERERREKVDQAAARLQLAADAAGIGVWEVTLPDHVLSWDSATRRIYGYGLDEAVPRSQAEWLQRVVPESREAILRDVQTAFRQAGPFELYYRIVRRDGAIRRVRSCGVVMAHRVLGVIVDETERLEQREALRISEERLRMAASAIQMGVWEAGADGPRAWDDGMLRIYAMTREEFETLQQSDEPYAIWNRYVHPDDQLRAKPVIREVLESSGRVDLRYRIIRPNGDIRYLRSAGIPVDVGTGKERVVGITMDVTDEVEAEAKLREAKDAAEAANRAKSSFLATMSHEIRTPLNSVIGLSNLLSDTQLDAVQQDYLHTIRTSGELLLSIVNDVLDYTKIEQGKLTLERVEFPLRAIAEEAIELVAESARAKGLHLRIAPTADPPHLLIGDPVRLKQVLLNLLSNAVKFTPSGSVTLHIAQEPGASLYRFSVVDTGLGISPEMRSHLFQAFSQGDASITRRFGGTGLGLAICARFVHLMGGQIGVESELGQGSTFWFTAPLETGSANQFQAPLLALEGIGALVVDGDAVDREALREQLTALGLRVDCASNALEALSLCSLAAASQTAYTVFLISARMPVMDGAKLAKVLRAQTGGDHRIIFLTADRLQTGRASQPGEGVENGRLLKPTPRRLLERVIRGELGRLQQSPAVDAPPHGGHILMVEDNRVNQKVAQAALQRLGYTADVAPDGVVALALFQQHRYDIVLMDCHMPRMDGFAATIAIRELEAGKQRIPIIALTADVLETSRQRCMASGMDDFLSKPLQISALKEALTRWRNGPQDL